MESEQVSEFVVGLLLVVERAVLESGSAVDVSACTTDDETVLLLGLDIEEVFSGETLVVLVHGGVSED